MKAYLVIFALSFVLLLLGGTAGNLLIDPYALYQQPEQALFPRKTAAAGKGRNIKSYQAEQRSMSSIIVGNSRVELGMPKSHPFYGDAAFNMGMPGAEVLMQYDYAWHAIKSGKTVKKVLLAVDFVDFLDSKDSAQQWDGNWQFRLNYRIGDGEGVMAPTRQRLFERFSFVLSQDALIDTLWTVLKQKRDVNALNYYGFNDGALYRHVVRSESYAALYRQKQQELQKRLSNPALKLPTDSADLQALERFIGLLQKENIQVVLFINPYQQPYLEVVEQTGLDDEMSRWKLKLQQIAQKYSVDLYDFAIDSIPVTTPAPLQSRDPDDNPYFWEPAHYKTRLGKLMLDAMQQKNCQQRIGTESVQLCVHFPSTVGQIKSN